MDKQAPFNFRVSMGGYKMDNEFLFDEWNEIFESYFGTYDRVNQYKEPHYNQFCSSLKHLKKYFVLSNTRFGFWSSRVVCEVTIANVKQK